MRGFRVSSKSKMVFLIILSCVLPCWQPRISGESRLQRILPEFRVKLLNETIFSYKDLLGKVTVIEFWGTWCKPCLDEIPVHNAFYRDYYPRGVTFFGLAIKSGEPKELKKVVKRLKIEYPIGAPSEEELKTIGQIRAYPTTWIINSRAEIAKEIVGVGYAKRTVIRETVDRLLAK